MQIQPDNTAIGKRLHPADRWVRALQNATRLAA